MTKQQTKQMIEFFLDVSDDKRNTSPSSISGIYEKEMKRLQGLMERLDRDNLTYTDKSEIRKMYQDYI